VRPLVPRYRKRIGATPSTQLRSPNFDGQPGSALPAARHDMSQGNGACTDAARHSSSAGPGKGRWAFTRVSIHDVEELSHCAGRYAPEVGVVALAVHGEGLPAPSLAIWSRWRTGSGQGIFMGVGSV
jgi:hypothetical protein